MLHYFLTAPPEYCAKNTKKLLTFQNHGIIIDSSNTSRGACTATAVFVRYGSLTREWGKVRAKAPHEPIPCALRKLSVGESQSLGAILRRQGMHLLEARVGKPTVSSECCFQNGYGDVLYG